MIWALWLAPPVVVGVLAAAVTWWRSRPASVPGTEEAVQSHRDYLAALQAPARGTARVPHPSD